MPNDCPGRGWVKQSREEEREKRGKEGKRGERPSAVRPCSVRQGARSGAGRSQPVAGLLSQFPSASRVHLLRVFLRREGGGGPGRDRRCAQFVRSSVCCKQAATASLAVGIVSTGWLSVQERGRRKPGAARVCQGRRDTQRGADVAQAWPIHAMRLARLHEKRRVQLLARTLCELNRTDVASIVYAPTTTS